MTRVTGRYMGLEGEGAGSGKNWTRETLVIGWR